MSEPIQAIATNNYLLATPIGSGYMETSALEYDGDKISGYSGSAFKAGDEFPQSATEAIETVTANSADWNGTTETVSSNSGAWGGSALPISAGPGIKFEMVDNTLVASTDETVLFTSDSGLQDNITLSENIENFDYVRVEWCPFKSNESWTVPYDCVTNKVNNGLLHLVGFGLSNDLTYQIETNLLLTCSTTSMSVNKCGTITIGPNNAGCTQLSGYQIYKVVGINRIAGGN